LEIFGVDFGVELIGTSITTEAFDSQAKVLDALRRN
jgi:hypothetical protein